MLNKQLADDRQDGSRPLAWNRDQLGRFVREAWVRWAVTQPNPKPSWLLPYDELAEPDKEADRQIGEAVARWAIAGDAALAASPLMISHLQLCQILADLSQFSGPKDLAAALVKHVGSGRIEISGLPS